MKEGYVKDETPRGISTPRENRGHDERMEVPHGGFHKGKSISEKAATTGQEESAKSSTAAKTQGNSITHPSSGFLGG